MSDLILPKHCLSKLKCNICKYYLSVPPISGARGQYSCGRCEPSKSSNELYEELAKLMSFPCIFENCTESISWGNIKQHEDVCQHKTIACPVVGCRIQHEIKKTASHFAVFHPDYTVSNPFTSPALRLKDISNAVDEVFCIRFQESTILMYVSIKNYFQGNYLRYTCAIGAFLIETKLDPSIKYDICLKLESAVESTTKSKTCLAIVPFEGKVHCFSCLNKECLVRGHANSGSEFLTTKFTDLDHKNNMHLIYTVKIHNSQKNADLASMLECPICNEYMCTPIYNCPKGHSFCKSCRRNITKCSFCQAKMETSRNYSLEAISDTVEISCHNAHNGCGFIDRVMKMKIHERTCNFS